MRNSKKYLIIIVIAAISIGVVFLGYTAYREKIEKEQFLANLSNLTITSNEVEAIKAFDSIENSGGGWFNINGYDSNPAKDIYYTTGQVHFADFASTTHLTLQQVNT